MFFKKAAAFILILAGGLAFAAGTKADKAVSENITVKKVEGLSEDFMKGVDISMLYEIEKAGGKYYNAQGNEDDLFNILKENGVNWIRLRVWNNPTQGGGSNSVENDIPMAVRAKKAGFKLLVDFHYSDFWSDPGKQAMPEEWKGLSSKQLNAAVKKYTKDSIEKFTAAGAFPDAVQIGNELNSGFMWPAGQLWSPDPSVKIGGMKEFTKLLDSASAGVRQSKGGEKIKIVIHLANGGDQELYKWIFDAVTKAKIDYDIIGLSFYTYWHGSLADLKANLEMISNRYGKQMAVVETAYAFTEEDGDGQGNVFQTYSDAEHGYVPSVQGQATAIRDIIETVNSVKGGCGVFYWEPAWIPVKGAGLSLTEGDTWENQSMFDFTGRVLPSLAVWRLVSGGEKMTNVWGGSAQNGEDFKPYAMASDISEIVALPLQAKVIFSDDSERLVDVKWDSVTAENGKAVVKATIKEGNYSYKPVANVIFSNKKNILEDSSFESGTWGNWKFNGPGEACFMENNKGNAHTGNWTYKYWLGTGFKSVLSQTLTGLENGTYELSVWAMGGGGENTIRLFAADYDGTDGQTTAVIKNTGWQIWTQYTIRVPVKGGKATIGIYLDTAPDCWGNFDDIEFAKVD